MAHYGIELEIERDFDTDDYSTRVGRGLVKPDRACASVLTLLLGDAKDSAFCHRLLVRALTHSVAEVAAFASAGAGLHTSDESRRVAFQVAAAHLLRARLLRQHMLAQQHRPYSEQLHGADLVSSVIPELREALEGQSLSLSHELEVARLDDWPGRVAARSLTELFIYQPEWSEAQQWFSRLAEWLVSEWQREHSRDDGRRDFELEHAASNATAEFALKRPATAALEICAPLLGAVQSHPRNTADFLRNLVLAADGREDDSFWDLWQSFADAACQPSWVQHLDRERSQGESFVYRLFLGLEWKEEATHWERLDGQAYRLEALLARLPAAEQCISSYAGYLYYSIGQQALPGGFVNVAESLARGEPSELLASSNTLFLLETILRRNVYSKPAELKRDESIRSSVVQLLDVLVDAGSSAAFRMRDDFVTPVPGE